MGKDKQVLENGQALVLLAVAFIGLLGFAALAIDGGMLYSDRRHAQNASDAAALAGGSAAALYLENHYVTYMDWRCTDQRVVSAQNHNYSGAMVNAISRAGSNDYDIDQDIADKNGVTTFCGNDDNGSWIDNYIDVRTMITADTRTAFAQLVFGGPLRNTVESVARVRPRSPLAFGNAIVALADVCQGTEGGVRFDGTSGVDVGGSGVFSNACMSANGSIDVDVSDGDITCIGTGCYTENGGPSVSPAPEERSVPLPEDAVKVPDPDCSGLPDQSSPPHGGEIQPGRYNATIRVNNNESLVMNPGLYCLSGGLVVNGNGTITGSGLTIYLQDGDFTSNGAATINLVAPPAWNCNNCPPAVAGVLIFMAPGNDGTVYVTGNELSDYVGTVYAPSGTIEAGGTSESLNLHTQLIGWTVNVHGTSATSVSFDEEDVYMKPADLELFK